MRHIQNSTANGTTVYNKMRQVLLQNVSVQWIRYGRNLHSTNIFIHRAFWKGGRISRLRLMRRQEN